MNRNNIYSVVILVFVWIILREAFSPFSLIVGIILSVGCLYFYHKYLPLKRVENIRYPRLILYVFYLVGQIYVSGFYVIKLIVKGASVDIIELKTKITNESLKVLLADSITLTPGSILLDLTDEKLTLLCLMKKNDTRDLKAMDDFLKGRLENQLIKVQK
ncbi:MAG: Na+/H+ antiporter subunit E [Oscillospiraceae bacterium]|nr:Na+/H+ antiporter subunit E [Oscillospiraceae bacterium]